VIGTPRCEGVTASTHVAAFPLEGIVVDASLTSRDDLGGTRVEGVVLLTLAYGFL
jgi:hypothetical protein